MYVSFDPEIRATYVQLEDGKVARTIEFGDLVMVDVDSDDRPLGAEFLALPHRITDVMLAPVVERFPTFKVLLDRDEWLAPMMA